MAIPHRFVTLQAFWSSCEASSRLGAATLQAALLCLSNRWTQWVAAALSLCKPWFGTLTVLNELDELEADRKAFVWWLLTKKNALPEACCLSPPIYALWPRNTWGMIISTLNWFISQTGSSISAVAFALSETAEKQKPSLWATSAMTFLVPICF